MDDKRLSDRKKVILRAIVDAHINHGEPVGSKYLAEAAQLRCSSATIRNEMSELEQMGYLVQPHTSAGRLPSEMAYRFYVDSLVHQYSSTRQEIEEIHQKLQYKLTEMDEILAEVSRLAASITDYTGIAFKTGAGNARVSRFDTVYRSPRDFLLIMMFSGDLVKTKHIRLPFSISEGDLCRFTEGANLYLVNLTAEQMTVSQIVRLEALMGAASAMIHPIVKVIYETMNELDSADIRIDGVNKLLQYPEYSDVDNLRGLLGMFEEKERLLDVIEQRSTETDDDIHVYIGDESDDSAMSNTTMIFKEVNVGGKKLSVGVIGPRRMNYSKVIGMIHSLASGIDQMFNSSQDALTDGEHDNTNGGYFGEGK